jgi:hypothetical protein
MKLRILSALAAAFLLSAATSALAGSGINVGVLSCTVEGGVGLILGSSKGAECVFQKSGGGRERYSGNIAKIGIDIGVTDESYIKWAVFAPGKIGKGALAGSYGGASAEVSAGLGLGANVLVGGFKRSIALQPLSVQGQTGLNVAVGISSLSLKLAR